MLSANASITYDTHAPARLVMRIGRRPQRSLKRPHHGAAISWHSEYEPRIGVIIAGGAPNRSAMYGTSGISTPKPRISMTLTRNRDPSCLFKLKPPAPR